MELSRNLIRPVKPAAAAIKTRQFYDVLRNQLPPNVPPPKNIGIAVSGGIDSLALCYLAAKAAQQKDWDLYGTRWYAFIINHNMRPGSLEEAEHVARMLKDNLYNVIPRVTTMQWPKFGKKGEKNELNARVNRYRLLAHLCSTWQCENLLVGHHMDDLAETILMRLVRDTGHRGLAGIADVTGMPESEDIHGAHMITVHRPLLGFTKAQLTTTLAQSSLIPVEDPTNHKPTFSIRNAIRSLIRAEPSPLPPALQVQSLAAFSRTIKQQNELGSDLVNAYIRLKVRIWPIREAAGTMLVKFPLDAFREEEKLLIRVLENIAARIMPVARSEWRTLQAAVRKLFFDNLDYVNKEDLEQEEEVDEYDALELPGAAYHRQTRERRRPKVPDAYISPASSFAQGVGSSSPFTPMPEMTTPLSTTASDSTAPLASSPFSTPATPQFNNQQQEITFPPPNKQIPPSHKKTHVPKNKQIVKIRKLPESFTACGLFWQPTTSRRWLISRQPMQLSLEENYTIPIQPYTSSVMRKWILYDRRIWILPPKSLPDVITRRNLVNAGIILPIPLTTTRAYEKIKEGDEDDVFFSQPFEEELPISHYKLRPFKLEDMVKIKRYIGNKAYERFQIALRDLAPGKIKFTMPVVVAVVDEAKLKEKRADGVLEFGSTTKDNYRVVVGKQVYKKPVFKTALETHEPVFRTALEMFDENKSAGRMSRDVDAYRRKLKEATRRDEEENEEGKKEEEDEDKEPLEVPIFMPTLPPPMKLLPELVPGRWHFKFRADREEVLKGDFGDEGGSLANAVDEY